MNKDNLNILSEKEFDDILKNTLNAKPPNEDIAKSITPWKKAFNTAILGMALSSLVPNILLMNYILPVIGTLLSIAGFRILRQENKHFRACYILSAVKAVMAVLNCIFSATVYSTVEVNHPLGKTLGFAGFAATFLIFIFFTLAIRQTQIKANIPVNIRNPVAMIFLYLVIGLLSLLQYNGIIIGWSVIIGYIVIAVNFFRIPKTLDSAGYVIKSAPVRVHMAFISVFVTLCVVAGVVCGYMFFHNFPMKWEETPTQEPTEITEIKEHLLSLGFPERVLDDMSEDDISACKNATKVFYETEEQSVDEEIDFLGINPDDPETKEIRFTHILIKDNCPHEQWRLIHHFEWINGDDFYGTEAIQIWSQYAKYKALVNRNSYSGRVLYTENGKNYASPFYSFTTESYKYDLVVFDKSTQTDMFANFSFPAGNLKQRGYVSYSFYLNSDTSTGSWINYNHQKTWMQFPVVSAAESRRKDSTVSNGAFIMILDAFTFFTDTEEFNY